MTSKLAVLVGVVLAIAGCGGGHDSHGGLPQPLPGLARLRFFSGSSQSGLGLASDGTALKATGPSSADFGESVAYENVPDGTVELSARTRSGKGTPVGTAISATFKTGEGYTAYAYGTAASGGLVFGPDTLTRTTVDGGLYLLVVCLLDGDDTKSFQVMRNGSPAVYVTFSNPGRAGFFDLSSYAGDGATEFALVRLTDDNGITVTGQPFTFTISKSNPVTVVAYGSASAPRYTVLQGAYLNPLAD